jgi:multidrug efflux pump subunit AcrA (membrane-fusion protein)
MPKTSTSSSISPQCWLPFRGEGLDRHGDRIILAGAAIAVIDDEIEVEQDAHQHRVAQLVLARAVGGQVEADDGGGQRQGDLARRPGPVVGMGRRPPNSSRRSIGQRGEARLKAALRIGQAAQPERARQAVERRQAVARRRRTTARAAVNCSCRVERFVGHGLR